LDLGRSGRRGEWRLYWLAEGLGRCLSRTGPAAAGRRRLRSPGWLWRWGWLCWRSCGCGSGR